MGDVVKVKIEASQNVTDALTDIQQEAGQTEKVLVGSMANAGGAIDDAGKSSSKLGDAFGKLEGGTQSLLDRVDTFASITASVTVLQHLGAQRASDQAHALVDVEQAMEDSQQAARDLEQAQLDLNQAQIDSRQAAADVEQAQIDAEQALVDASVAQKEYNAAVAEFGPNSDEANQAAVDLKQAQQDLNQANIDSEQAQQDAKQAIEDSAQAQRDMAQASIDAKAAQVDLADAQRAAVPPTAWQTWTDTIGAVAPLIMGAVAAIDLLKFANLQLIASTTAHIASLVAQKVAVAASAVATGVATAAQWAWNAAMLANPIGLIIAAIVAVIAVIVLIATKTTWFQDLWHFVWGHLGDPVQALWSWMVGSAQWVWNALTSGVIWVRDTFIGAFRVAVDHALTMLGWLAAARNWIYDAFAWLGNALTWPFKAAFNWIASAWNNTVGSLSFTIPGWVPGIGGNSFSMPKLPHLALGGEILRSGLAFVHEGEQIRPASTRGLDPGDGAPSYIVVEIKLTGGPEEFRKFFAKNTRVFGGGSSDNVRVAWAG